MQIAMASKLNAVFPQLKLLVPPQAARLQIFLLYLFSKHLAANHK